MPSEAAVKELGDGIASIQALIDQAQAHLDDHKGLWTEEEAWYIQAEIDTKQFHLEVNKLNIEILTNM